MPYSNGRLPRTALAKIAPDMYLSAKTARAWNRLRTAARKQLGRTIAAAAPAGAYRSYATQDAMHRAGSAVGTRDARIRWGLNPNSTVAIAAAGTSTHGFGTRIDIVGTAIDSPFLALARRHGFTLEFGPRDPNHFRHDGTTATGIIRRR